MAGLMSVCKHPLPLRLCIIFDFDETLAVDTGEPTSDPLELFGGAERIKQLHALFTELRQAGVILSICSFNMRMVFEPLLRSAGLLPFFEPTLLFGSEVFDEDGPLAACGWGDKGIIIDRLILPKVLPTAAGTPESALLAELAPPSLATVRAPFLPCRGTVDASADSTSTVLFVDDLADNVIDVHVACPCCATLLAPSRGGLQPAQLVAIRVWAAAARPSADFDVFDDDNKPPATKPETSGAARPLADVV